MQCSNQQWLALIRARGVGNRTLLPLIQQSTDLDSLLGNAPQAAREKLSRAINLADRQTSELIEKDLLWLEKPGNHLITLNDRLYPELLKQTDDAPVALFVQGDLDLLNLPQLAIVGSRNQFCHFCMKLICQ